MSCRKKANENLQFGRNQTNAMKLKIGIVGAGKQGSAQLACLKGLSELYTITGLHDRHDQRGVQLAAQNGLLHFHNVDALLDASDVVSIATTSSAHYNIALAAIKRLKHVIISSPVCMTIDEARFLIKLSREAGVFVQVMHLDHFSAPFQAIKSKLAQPRYIESHRELSFNSELPNHTLVLDEIIHDIELVLAITGANVRKISANEMGVYSELPDTVNVRLEMDNGTVANLTAGKTSSTISRAMRIAQKGINFNINFSASQSQTEQLKHVVIAPPEQEGNHFRVEEKRYDEIEVSSFGPFSESALAMAFKSFAFQVEKNQLPEVSIEHGARALDVALQVLEKLKQHILIQDDNATNNI
jgi:predicted dehydrogenase